MADVFQAHRRDSDEVVEFTVEWANPDDANLVWRWDAEHNPFPLSPLSANFSRGAAVGPGGMQGGGSRVSINVHGYRYSAGRGRGRPRAEIAAEDLEDQLNRIDEIWENGWRARIEREANAVAYEDYDAMSLSGLVRRMEHDRDQIATHMDIMFRALDIVGSGRDRLTEFLTEELAGKVDVERVVSELLEGQWSVSLNANAQLWDVAQMARTLPAVEQAIRVGEAETLVKRLHDTDGGAAVATAFEAWLERFGRRSGDYGELMEPTWKEDPTPVAIILRGYLDREDPRAAVSRAASRKQAVVTEIMSLLPAARRDTFEKLVTGVEHYIPVKESRNSVMCLSGASLRVPALAAGRKLVSLGAIDEVEDVFFLTFAEIETAEDRSKAELQAIISQRRNEYELWRNVVPPATIGGTLPAAETNAEQIKGVAASRGVARGRARVVLHLAESDKLQPGEILVTRSTTSAWTPLFLNAAGIVTDSGGILSHCAVVAREYQLPAVVGTYTATRLISDGDMLEIDGATGLVTISR
jgi:pyruvate,water dikinase